MYLLSVKIYLFLLEMESSGERDKKISHPAAGSLPNEAQWLEPILAEAKKQELGVSCVSQAGAGSQALGHPPLLS